MTDAMKDDPRDFRVQAMKDEDGCWVDIDTTRFSPVLSLRRAKELRDWLTKFVAWAEASDD